MFQGGYKNRLWEHQSFSAVNMKGIILWSCKYRNYYGAVTLFILSGVIHTYMNFHIAPLKPGNKLQGTFQSERSKVSGLNQEVVGHLAQEATASCLTTLLLCQHLSCKSRAGGHPRWLSGH